MVLELKREEDTRIGARVEPGARCIIEVDSRPRLLVTPGPYTVPAGKSQLNILKDDLPKFMSQIETDEALLATAETVAKRKRETALKKFLAGVTGDAVARMTEEFDATWNETPESVFREMTGGERDVLPFRSVKVIRDDMPALVDEARVASETATARAVAKAVAESLGKR